MTAAEIIAQAQRHNHNTVTTGALDSAWYLARVNEAYRWLTTYRNPQTRKKLRFQELYDVVERTLAAAPSTNFVTNSADVFNVHSIWDTTNARLIPEKSAVAIQRRDPTATGKIIMWGASGDGDAAGYLIWRKNTDATDIRESVYKYPTALTTTPSTSPVIPDTWHEVIALDAGRRAARLSGDFELAGQLRAELLDEIESRVSSLEEPGQNGPRYHFIGRRF